MSKWKTEGCLVYKILKKEFKLIPNKEIEQNGTIILKKFSHNITEVFSTNNNKICISKLGGEDKLSRFIEQFIKSREKKR